MRRLIPPWRKAWRRLLAVLPGVLGGTAALLGLVALLGEGEAGAMLLGAVLALPLATILAQMLREAWVSGVLPGRFRFTQRASRPVRFGAGMIFYAACALALSWLGLWCLWRFLALVGSELL